MRHLFLTVFLFILLLTSAAHAGTVTVSCSQPVNSSTVVSPVTFNCSATTTSGSVTGWHIYVDNVDSYSNVGPTSSISTSLTMNVGTRNVTVKAWDSTGASGTKALSLNVTTATLTASCTSPQNNGSYTNPITFDCTATGGTVTDWQVFQNGVLMNVWTGIGGHLVANYSLSAGTGQSVAIKAFNSAGQTTTVSRTLNITDQTHTSIGGDVVYFTESLTSLTKNNTGMDDAWNTDPNWGWSSWHNDPDKWGHVSDSDIHEIMYSGASTKWYMYHEPWFNDNDPKNCPTQTFVNPYGESHTHPFDDSGGHRCIGYSNNTDDSQVTKQINFIRLAGFAGVNINVYGPEHASGAYNGVTNRFMTVGKNYSPQFEVMLNEDGGGSRICARGGSWSGTGFPTSTYCYDPYHYNTAYSAAEIRNTNCASLPWLDPNTTAVNVGNDQATCFITKHMLSHIAYYYDTFFNQSNYAKYNGRPIYTFFGDETIQYYLAGNLRTANPDRAWLKQMAAKYFGNPIFLYRQSSGFSKPGSDGSYAWTVHESGDAYTPNSTYLSSFYNTGKASGKIIMGAVNPSFDNHEAGWGAASTLHRTCGKTFLFGIDQINAAFNSATQLPYAIVATLNDHEEGSGIEMGLETCWRISSVSTTDGVPGISNTTMSWSLNPIDPDGSKSQRTTDATIRTVSKIRIWATDRVLAGDGSYRMGKVATLSPTASSNDGCYTVNTSSLPYTYSLDLRCYTGGLPSGTYYFYVEMVGVAFMQNRLSQSSVTYTVANAATNHPPIGNVDGLVDQADGDSQVPRNGTLAINGWAADPEDGSPITTIEVYDGSTLLGTATKNKQRTDIAASYGRNDYLNSGWTFNYTVPLGATLGAHTFSAKLYDSAGLNAVTNSVTATILDVAPTAVMTLTPASGSVPLAVTANTSSSSAPSGKTITQRQIDWGDGTGIQVFAGTSTQHTYSTVGTYNVIFTITDSGGGTARALGTVTVYPPAYNYVSIDSLEDGAFVYTPIRVESTASVLHGPVTKMQIWVDGELQFDTPPYVNPATIDKYVFASANNTHTIEVRAYDSDGNSYSRTVQVTVVGVM